MKHLPIILTCGLLAGCVHYQPQPLAPEKSAAQLDARRLDDAGLEKFIATNAAAGLKSWPLEKWDLNSLTLAAFYFHPDLAVARAQWQLADAGVKTAGGRPNPTLGLTPEYNSTTYQPTPWAPSVNLDLPIETMGKRGKRIAEAEKISESARWTFVAATWQIRREVRAALVEFSAAEQRLPLLQHQLTSQTEITRLSRGSYDAGEIARQELTAAQIALSKAQLDFSSAETALSEARSRLAEAIGVTLGALAGIQIETDLPTDISSDLTSTQARRAALLGRADIRASLADYAASEENLRLEIAKQYPDVHLNPGYQYDQGDNKWSVGLTFELPLLNQNQGPIAESQAKRELAAVKFLQLQAQVSAQVDRAVSGWQSAQAQLKISSELGIAAQRQQKSVADLVQAGGATRMDLAAAEIELAAIRLAQLDSETQLQTALSALEDALQCPTDSIVAVIEKISTKNPDAKKVHP